MRRNILESIVGAVVLIVALSFLYFGWQVSDVRVAAGYSVTARFLNIGGLEAGSDVRINGVKVGNVTARVLELDTFDAVVTMTVGADFRLPADSQASIVSNGLLGGKYVRIKPGRDAETIPAGGEIKNTVDHKSLEDTVSEIIYLATGGG
jgi:phospholipid/cholesterol/gamma-HCH transport system substrate-binding protein